jgi:hypothetical protein
VYFANQVIHLIGHIDIIAPVNYHSQGKLNRASVPVASVYPLPPSGSPAKVLTIPSGNLSDIMIHVTAHEQVSMTVKCQRTGPGKTGGRRQAVYGSTSPVPAKWSPGHRGYFSYPVIYIVGHITVPLPSQTIPVRPIKLAAVPVPSLKCPGAPPARGNGSGFNRNVRVGTDRFPVNHHHNFSRGRGEWHGGIDLRSGPDQQIRGNPVEGYTIFSVVLAEIFSIDR